MAKRKRKVSLPKTGIYKTIEYDSLEELSMLQWLFELKDNGMIKSIERSPSFLLCDSYINNYVQEMKKVSSRPATQIILRGHSYTPEFKVVWNPRAINKVVWLSNSTSKFTVCLIAHLIKKEIVTYIEVKPLYDQNNMERLFKINQKWMWEKYQLLVNLLKVDYLFPSTFTPKEYLKTPSGTKRAIKWKIIPCTTYLK